MSGFEVVGHWWLPEDEARKLPGVLTVDAQGASQLLLIGGALKEVTDVATWTHSNGESSAAITEDDLEVAGTYDRILGEAEGGRYTLEGGVQVKYQGAMFGGAYRQLVHVQQVFKGVHFDGTGALSANAVFVQPGGLETWVGRSGITGIINVKPGEEPRYELTAESLPVEAAQLADGGKLELRHRTGRPQQAGGTWKINEYFSFGLRYPTVLPMTELIDTVSDLQDLLSIATGRPAAFETLSFRHPDVYQEIPDTRPELKESYPDGRRYTPIQLWAQWTVDPSHEARLLRGNDLLFSLGQLGGLDGAARWLAVARKHRSTLGRVMATRYSTGGYLHDRYMDRLAALEGLDRDEHNDSVIYVERIKRCAQNVGQPMQDLVGGRVDKWAKQLKDDRNDMAHHKGVRLDEQFSEQYFMSESAYWLYVFQLLRLVDAPDAVFDQIVQHQELLHLKRQLDKILV
ncbi:hypothetical protein OHA72_01325 [Dactylosporangium sp. NBC_01737]|uniref:ApeA N-terminal domain 1-containing protein n=1 Tax=Dactylosporangium sp. NBC_01737 TaxID=2975959 RepID=UPI002E142BAF|nr:hypothetical protein OHA72_01325 [Dactylosporangium sp. NBC_01737]